MENTEILNYRSNFHRRTRGELEITVQHNEPIDKITQVNNTLEMR
jgi:hypothetical protein